MMDDKVREALEILDQYARHKKNRIGDYWGDAIAAEKLATIRAYIEGLEADAGRYRWLREGDNDEYVLRCSDGSPFPVMDPDETGPAFLLRLEKLDAAIDSAMQENRDG